MPSGSASKKKKKWHLADAMEFLLPWTGPSRKMSSSLDKQNLNPDTAPPTQETTTSDNLSYEDEINDEQSAEVGNFYPKKKLKKTPAELLANPMAEYLKTITKHKLQEVKGDNEFLSFFKSLIPDAEKLSDRRKRKFKTSVMSKLHQLLDEQEDEQASYSNISSRVASSCGDTNTQDVVQQSDVEYNYSQYGDEQYQLHELLVLPKNQ